ncbi:MULTISPECIES: helix-turn-helix domain-containing protein [Shouchella]|uniref:helix-turn-helix domain-containing protein n=1 Tax=Shouchella TaxID=2893057 RepID=UPI0009234B71|nr:MULTISPECIES: helix-turn-helix transcriptional regulator [Shouchella]MDO7282665.1 helix-turn-helix transcriptional regulator [Shouchella clausii]MDO7302762.1 helix-turn-helix transcriptional regulator [Shouchella clausii]PAE94044.1 helix-turn-helix domain-containing protein [Shouchella clausii]SHK94592.1 Transcriptional regulator, contains XRE-family HTH domain [Shouchella rhizosphaerae]
MEFYKKLKKLRAQKGWSQEEFAEHLQVSRQAVSKWENGQGFPETEKLVKMSKLFQVSLDYLLKDEDQPPGEQGTNEEGYYASQEVVEAYLLKKKQGAQKIAAGVAVLIASIVLPMTFQEAFGYVLFMMVIAVGVAILVWQGFSVKKYKKLEMQPLVFDDAFIHEFRQKSSANRKRYGVLIVTGIVIIILSFAIPFLTNSTGNAGSDRLQALMPVIWALAVYLFIIAGSAMEAERLVANNEEYVKENEEYEKSSKHGWIHAVIWPLATVIFLAIGFIWDTWHPGWLVFPAGAVLTIAYMAWKNSRD